MAAWCRGECEPQPNDRFSSELTLVAIRAIERRGRDTDENKNATETDNSINIPLNSNRRRINYQQIPLFSLCQQIVGTAIKSLYHFTPQP